MRPDDMPGIADTEGSFWTLTCAMLLIVWGGTHFCLLRVLEHLAFTVSCGRPTHLQPDYSLAKRGFPRRRHSAGRPNLTRTLCSIGWWSSPRCSVWIQCVVFGRRYPRILPGEGLWRFSGIIGEAQSNWLGGQLEQMRAHHPQWQHDGGNGGLVQRALSGG